jgi:hypothetical protein
VICVVFWEGNFNKCGGYDWEVLDIYWGLQVIGCGAFADGFDGEFVDGFVDDFDGE